MKNLSAAGGILFVLGLAGMAEAITGQGSFMVGAVMFSVGIGLCLCGLRGDT